MIKQKLIYVPKYSLKYKPEVKYSS